VPWSSCQPLLAIVGSLRTAVRPRPLAWPSVKGSMRVAKHDAQGFRPALVTLYIHYPDVFVKLHSLLTLRGRP
jgi:hypothetical protein